MSISPDIVTNIVATIEGILNGSEPLFKKVEAKLPFFDDLKAVPSTLFPYVAVSPKVPLPQSYNYKPDRRDGKFYIYTVETELRVNVNVYAEENVTPLTAGLSYVSEVYSALLADVTRGGKALKTEVYPRDMDTVPPFLVILLEVVVTFRHDETDI